MGVLLILLGLAAAGLVADFVVENDLTTAPNQTVDLFGGSFQLSLPEMVLGAAVLGALAVVLVILGLGLRSRVHLGNVAAGPSQEGQADASD